MTTQEDKIRDKPEFPIKFHFMEESIKSPIIDLFPGQAEGMVRGESGGLVFTPEYGRRAHKIYQFESKEDDVWICTFPKSGELSYSYSSDFKFTELAFRDQSPLEMPFIIYRNDLDARNGVVDRKQLRH